MKTAKILTKDPLKTKEVKGYPVEYAGEEFIYVPKSQNFFWDFVHVKTGFPFKGVKAPNKRNYKEVLKHTIYEMDLLDKIKAQRPIDLIMKINNEKKMIIDELNEYLSKYGVKIRMFYPMMQFGRVSVDIFDFEKQLKKIGYDETESIRSYCLRNFGDCFVSKFDKLFGYSDFPEN